MPLLTARSVLLAGAGQRVALALIPVVALWLGVLWAALGVRPPGELERAASPPVLQQIAVSGQLSPIGGSFDRFDVAGQAIPAPTNSTADVAFFANLVRGKAQEGLFIAKGERLEKIAAVGDIIPGGERIADFTDHPVLALNSSGTVAFAAALSGGKATSGVFLAGHNKIEPIALSGASAPDITGGTLVSFERPVLDESGNAAVLALVRRGREASDAILLRRGTQWHKLVAVGDRAPGGGNFSGFGAPAINNLGAVAFPAVIEQGPILGGIYLFEEGEARLALGAGSPVPDGGIFGKFSEQVAINDAGAIVFSAVLRQGGPPGAVFMLEGEAVRRVAAIGDPAPGGGTFSAFTAWPVLSPLGTIGFVASVDGGPSSSGIFISTARGLERLAAVGDTLPTGGRLASFPLYPAIAIGPDDAVTFASTSEREAMRRDTLFYYGPQRRARN
jgi:hypothetical protein